MRFNEKQLSRSQYLLWVLYNAFDCMMTTYGMLLLYTPLEPAQMSVGTSSWAVHYWKVLPWPGQPHHHSKWHGHPHAGFLCGTHWIEGTLPSYVSPTDEEKMLVNIFIIWLFSQVTHKQMTNIKTYSLPIDCFWKLSIRIQSTMDIGWVSSIKSELCEVWIIWIFR